MMKNKTVFLIVITLMLLSGCTISGGSKGRIPTKEFVANVKSGSLDTAYYIFREKSFGGSLAQVSVVCNDELFNLADGEFIECQPWTPINYIGIDFDDQSGDLSSLAMPFAAGVVYDGLKNINKYNNNFLSKDSNLIFINKREGNRFVLVRKPSLFKSSDVYGVKSLISKDKALELIDKGYKLVEAPEATSPIFRYTAILNPFSSVDYGFLTQKATELPHMLINNIDLSSFVRGKQGVVIYTESDVEYPAGIWLKDKYIGSLIGKSYIFVETALKEETLYTYLRGTLRKITLPIKEGEVTYIKLDAGFNNISASLGFRYFSSSTKEQFMSQVEYLNRLELNQNADTSPSITEIEVEGIKILNEIVGSK